MSNKDRTAKRRGAELPPMWTSALALIAHPDNASYGLGVVLDAFVLAGVRVEVLCLTHGQAWTLDEAPGDLAALRGVELASAADVLGPARVKMEDCPDGGLRLRCLETLAAEVVATADSCRPDGLLVFDAPDEPGAVDHVAVATVALQAAETLGTPVLGWTMSQATAARLNQESHAGSTGHQGGEIDLRVTIERARQRLARRASEGPPLPGSDQWRRLELLAETGGLHWLRPPGSGASRRAATVSAHR